MTDDTLDHDPPFSEPVELEITDTLDLHAFRPSEARKVLEAYLAEAHSKGFRLVRIIHGKGVGVQREMTRSVLAGSELVESYRSGDEFSGGWGATIAKLKQVSGPR
jgi:DNA-nicking Smr family endonuclease